MADDEDVIDDPASDAELTDKYRSRSRSVASLTATAAGALAAGLAINPDLVQFPLITRALGLATVLLLVLATGVFVIGSVIHGASAQQPDRLSRTVNRIVRPWEARFNSQGQWPTAAEYRASTEEVQKRIMRTTDVGMWLSSLAVLSLIAALISMFFINSERISVEMHINSTPGTAALCPDLPELLKATVQRTVLESAAPELSLRISGKHCASGLGDVLTELTVLRADVLIVHRTSQ